jgi:hypothetical protein
MIMHGLANFKFLSFAHLTVSQKKALGVQHVSTHRKPQAPQ